MRFRLVLLFALSLLPTAGAVAHPGDAFPQVTLQIAIDDQAVELVVTIPASDAKRVVFDGLSPVEMDMMEPADLAALIQPVFADRCPVTIDGVEVLPTIVGAVVTMRNSRLPARRFPEPQVLKQGALKFLARYETKGSPGRVSLDWSIFANQYDEAGEPTHAPETIILAALVIAEGQEHFAFLSPLEPGFTWHAADRPPLPADLLAASPIQRRFLYVPVLTIALFLLGVVGAGLAAKRTTMPKAAALFVGACLIALAALPVGRLRFEHTPTHAPLDDDTAISIFETLHRNIYRAFDYTDEGAVYDALAQSVDGPMLETIYNDVYQSLIMREENGAVSKVVRVEIEEAILQPLEEPQLVAYGPTAYRVYCTWQVDGLVTHFGHSHARTNAYTAVYVVAMRAEGWRIVESEIIDQQRIDDGNPSAEDQVTKP